MGWIPTMGDIAILLTREGVSDTWLWAPGYWVFLSSFPLLWALRRCSPYLGKEPEGGERGYWDLSEGMSYKYPLAAFLALLPMAPGELLHPAPLLAYPKLTRSPRFKLGGPQDPVPKRNHGQFLIHPKQ